MAHPNGPSVPALDDSDRAFRQPDASRESMSTPAAPSAIGVSLASRSGANVPQSMTGSENHSENPASTAKEVTTAPAPAAAAAAASKKSRSTFSHAKKKLTAKKSLWLHSQHEDQCVGPDLELSAVIVECPFKAGKKANGDRCRLDWQKLQALPNGVEVAMLREWVNNTDENKQILREAIDLCETNNKTTNKKRKQTDGPVTPRGPHSPPEHATYAARADAMTASTMSSLSTLGSSSSSARAIRTEDANQSDPEDDRPSRASRSEPHSLMSDGEDDNCDLDEDDNACSCVNDPAHADETHESELETPDSSAKAQGTMVECLRGLHWKFEPVTQDTTTRPAHRPYTASPFLKPGVSRRFNDPFECLAECGGLTPEFVARLAANSNDCFETHIKPSLGRVQKCHKSLMEANHHRRHVQVPRCDIEDVFGLDRWWWLRHMLHSRRQDIACRNRTTRKEDHHQWQSRLGSGTHATVAIQANEGCFPPRKQSRFLKQRQVLSIATCHTAIKRSCTYDLHTGREPIL